MRFIMAFLVFLGLLGGSFALTARYLEHWSQESHLVREPVVLSYPKGTRLRDLATQLEKQGVITQATAFVFWVRLQGSYSRFQAGDYRFEGAVSPAQVASAISRGDAYRPIVLQVNIPEGFAYKQVVDRLVARGLGTPADYEAMNRRAFLEKMGIDADGLEGYLYPATYSFTRLPTPTEAIVEMVTTFKRKLPANYTQRLQGVGLNLRQAVIFASLIELETRFDDERPLVSEVIWRRLQNNEPIGIDAALIYGIKDYQGNIKWTHLRDAKNLYNTRIHKGLPPTPIGSPSLASLEAVLNPSKFGYYYYVLKPGGEGRHHFSKTLSEHNMHVKSLVESMRQRNGK